MIKKQQRISIPQRSRLPVLLLALLFSISAWADYPLEIIELKGRTSEEIIPIIQPLVEPDGVVTGMQNQLIIRTSPENLVEIKKLLESIDRPPRRLLIYVRQGTASIGRQYGQNVDINTQVGKQTRVTVGEGNKSEGIRYRVHSSGTRSHLDTTQHIRATEGRPAFIVTGKSVPVEEQTTTVSGGVVQQQNTVRYKDVTTGFYVTPRLHDKQVTLDISPHMERSGAVSGTYDIQQASTTVSGRLGEWISVGGATNRTTNNRAEILKESSTRSRDDTDIQLLVEEVQ
jgi:type II secretory pathway component GspD/PulD (secretin)